MLSYGLKCKSSSTDTAQNKTSYQVSNHRNCIHTKLNFECFPFTQSLNFQACMLIYCLSDLHHVCEQMKNAQETAGQVHTSKKNNDRSEVRDVVLLQI